MTRSSIHLTSQDRAAVIRHAEASERSVADVLREAVRFWLRANPSPGTTA